MKKILFTLCTVFSFVLAMAQVPPAFNYQAVARNNSGVALANQTMQVRLSVKQSAATLYSETRTVTTNALGLFNVQIGSAGASSSSGSISAVDWGNSSAGWYSLKVELDLANNNVFTDMGTQPLTSVPFSLAAEKANEAKSLENFPVAALPAPAGNNRLAWNGSAWAPVKKDTIITRADNIVAILAQGSLNPVPWVFVSSSSTYTDVAQITVTGNETIVANFNASLGHTSPGSSVNIDVCMCYQNMSGGTITPFYTDFGRTYVPFSGGSAYGGTIYPVTGSIKLPAGTYRIGMGVRNKNTTINLGSNENYNGVIEVRY